MTDLKDKRISFLSGLFGAFKEEIHTDTQLKPGDDGPCIPAHRVILVTPFPLSLSFSLSLS